MLKARTHLLLLFVFLCAFIIPSLGRAGSARADGGVVSENTCGAPALGRITCDAQILVSRRTHRPVRPRVLSPRRRQRLRVHHDLAATGLAAPQQMTPAYLQQAYDLSYLSATRGSGDTVAIVGVFSDPTAASDLATFRAAYGLPACTTANGCFQQLNEQGQPSPLPAPDSSWGQEESMDIEAVSSLCPNCKIDLVEASNADAQDLQATISAAIAAGASQVSISGDGVYPQSPFTNFSAPGVSIVAASGDNGALPAGQDAYPAALPWVTAVGGTTLTPDSSSAPTPRGVTETAWNGSGAGCDTTEQPPPYQPADGCAGRSYADISAVADPSTGLTVFDSAAGGWFDGGGTSLAAPLVAAFEAVTGVDGSTPQWAYTDAASLNDPLAGSTGACAGQLQILCNAGPGYDGPTGAGSISGQIVAGAPGVGLPAFGPADNKTYTLRVTDTGAYLRGGVYPNAQATTYYWQYGTSADYGLRTRGYSAGAGGAPVGAIGHLIHLQPGTRYHYRLVGVNASGTTYGYDSTFATTGRASAARARRAHAKRGQEREPRASVPHRSSASPLRR